MWRLLGEGGCEGVGGYFIVFFLGIFLNLVFNFII